MRVERLLAPNPGLFTGPGTNTYLLDASGDAMVVDPGPVDSAHRDAVLAAIAVLRPRGVMVTHSHPDHAPLANPLGRELGVPVYGHQPGPDFDPDVLLADGDTVELGGEGLLVLHTPGHSRDHLCFQAGSLLFTGDHVMGGSTVVVEDMTAYLASLRRLQPLSLERIYPGHGPALDDPAAVLADYIAHRMQREREILAALAAGAASVGGVVTVVYADVDSALHPLAAISVAAHLAKLAEDGLVRFAPTSPAALWEAPVELEPASP